MKGRLKADGGSGSGSDRVELARGGCVMVPDERRVG